MRFPQIGQVSEPNGSWAWRFMSEAVKQHRSDVQSRSARKRPLLPDVALPNKPYPSLFMGVIL